MVADSIGWLEVVVCALFVGSRGTSWDERERGREREREEREEREGTEVGGGYVGDEVCSCNGSSQEGTAHCEGQLWD